MSERGMSDDQIERVFGALARIEQKQDSNAQKWDAHEKLHAVVEEDILKLKLSAAKQRGVIAAVAGMGSALGAGVGYAIDIFSKAHK